jgi:hypothetical protein
VTACAPFIELQSVGGAGLARPLRLRLCVMPEPNARCGPFAGDIGIRVPAPYELNDAVYKLVYPPAQGVNPFNLLEITTKSTLLWIGTNAAWFMMMRCACA